MNKRVAILLSGCGHKDGTEITEVVSAWVALSECGATTQFFAPDMELVVRDPISASPTGERRSALKEAARISRGKIKSASELKAKDFDALVIPGGFGAALNLCTWAKEGAACSIQADAERAIQEFYEAQKPIGAICIAPALVARVLGSHGITVTIGEDVETAAEITKTGASHEKCAVEDFVTDREHRVITTPAYMYSQASPHEVFNGIRKAMREVVEMA